MSCAFQQRADKSANVFLVVHDEDPGTGHRISFHRGIRDSCAFSDSWVEEKRF
jgi:hypothetical protein